MPCGKPVEKLAPPPKIQSGLTTSPPFPTSLHDFPHTSPTLPPHFPHFPHTSPTRKMLGKRLSRCAPKRYMHPFPHFPNIRYILLPLFFLSSSFLFFSPIKKGKMLGKLGKSASNSLSPSQLWLPPHFFQCGEVGESWGKLGVCGGEVGSVCGGAAKLGGGVGQKKYPPKSGGDGYFACKGGAKLRRSLRRRGRFRSFRRFLASFFVPLWVRFGVFFVPLRYGYFAGRKCSRKGGNA